MATPRLPTGGPTAGGDGMDDLDNYDFDADDPFAENYKAPNARENPMNTATERAKGVDALGVDEVVEVVKNPRAPRVKLDERRLLSDAGIPKLRRNAKKHLKLKGKGHEYSDAARLLAFYQLWLDDLFPKAKFLDALAMVEKMGHKKQVQSMRMEWINEGKPKSTYADDEPVEPTGEHEQREKTASRIAPIFEKTATARLGTPEDNPDVDMDDIYNATPKASRQKPTDNAQSSLFGGTNSIFGSVKTSTVNEGAPDDDELDALLAEDDAGNTKAKTISHATTITNDFDELDDLDALLAEGESMQVDSTKSKPVSKPMPEEQNYDDDMEAMAEMGF